MGTEWLNRAAEVVATPEVPSAADQEAPVVPAAAASSENTTNEHRRHDPPNFIYAPGYYKADAQSYLVAYPGMNLGDGLVGLVLARRFTQANAAVFRTAQQTYGEMARLGARSAR